MLLLTNTPDVINLGPCDFCSFFRRTLLYRSPCEPVRGQGEGGTRMSPRLSPQNWNCSSPDYSLFEYRVLSRVRAPHSGTHETRGYDKHPLAHKSRQGPRQARPSPKRRAHTSALAQRHTTHTHDTALAGAQRLTCREATTAATQVTSTVQPTTCPIAPCHDDALAAWL